MVSRHRSATFHQLVVESNRYVAAVASTAIAVCARIILHPWLNEECPFSFFYLSVLVTAWIAGTGPAVLAIFLGTISAAYFFITPESSIAIDNLPELLQLIIYVIVNCVATSLFNRLQRQRALAEQRSRENEQLSRSLRRADERKDEFLALLAHELRNPLAPIRTAMVMLRRDDQRSPVVERVLPIIERQTDNLVRITDDLLDISRFCRGKVRLKVERTDLRLAVADAVEMTQSLLIEKAHNFQSLIPEHPVWVEADHLRVAQLTANLLGNAAKYTPPGGRIVLELDQLGEEVTLVVRDNGIGFSAEDAEQLIQPFVQLDTSRTREYGGLGLGLAIVDRLVKLHQGKLIATSRGPGKGSCFMVKLPASQVSESSEVQDSSCDSLSQQRAPVWGQPVPLDANQEHGRTRILLVEDSVDVSTVLGELLTSDGFDVETAHDGLTALQNVGRRMPDICILDIGLPAMDGYELARRIRRSTGKRRVRLIAATGWGSDVDRQRAQQAGFDAHLTKPIIYDELLSIIRSDESTMSFAAADRANA